MTVPKPALLQHQPMARPMRVRDGLALLLLCALGLLWFHRTDLTSGFTAISGDVGDTRLIAFLLEHQWQALHGQVPWTSPPMFWPTTGTLGYADALALHALLYLPLRALGVDMLTALQVATLVLNAASFAAMAWLLRGVLRLGTLPTMAGAWLFAFNSAKFNQFVHLQLQPLVLLPLIVAVVVLLVRQLDTLSPRAVFWRLALAATLLNLQLMSSVYIAWFFGFYGLLFLALLLLLTPTRLWLLGLLRQHRRPLLGALVVFLIGAVPFALLYVPVVRQAGWRSFGDAEQMIPRFTSLLAMGEFNWLWGWLERVLHFAEKPFFWEQRLGLGAVATLSCLLLTGVALRSVRALRAVGAPTSQHFLTAALLAITANYLLGMSYFGHSPWWFAFHAVPGIKSIRAVSRYVLVLALPLAIVLAWMTDALQARLRWRGQIALWSLVAFFPLCRRIISIASASNHLARMGRWLKLLKRPRIPLTY